jgi:hypothetical protein
VSLTRDEIPERSRTRRMRCARATWRARAAFAELRRLNVVARRSPGDARVEHELIAVAGEYVSAWRVIEHSVALGDPYGVMPGEADELRHRAGMAGALIDEIAPPPADKPANPADAGRYAATPAIGTKAARSKLASLAGRLLSDGAEPSLARRYVQLENESTCVPPLPRSKVDELLDWVLAKHVEGDQ